MDLDRLLVNLKNLETQKANLQLQYQQLLEVLKYQMMMPLGQSIVLTDTLKIDAPEIPENAMLNPDLDTKNEMLLLNLKGGLQEIDRARIKASYGPTIFALGEYGFNAWGNSFGELFGRDYWYSNANLGLKMELPIFDGFKKRAQLSRLSVEKKQWEQDLAFTRLSLELQFNNARQKLLGHYNNLTPLKENKDLSEEIYTITQKRFTEGEAPIYELLAAETAMREAQSNYLSALLELKLSELEVNHAQGNLLKALQ